MVGEHLFVEDEELVSLTARDLPPDSPFVRRLRSKQIIRRPDETLPVRAGVTMRPTPTARQHRLPVGCAGAGAPPAWQRTRLQRERRPHEGPASGTPGLIELCIW